MPSLPEFGKKHASQPAPGPFTKTRRQLTRQFRDVALQHNRATRVQLIPHRGDYVGMVVAHVVYTVSGKEV
jgi:hypothetical protein